MIGAPYLRFILRRTPYIWQQVATNHHTYHLFSQITLSYLASLRVVPVIDILSNESLMVLSLIYARLGLNLIKASVPACAQIVNDDPKLRQILRPKNAIQARASKLQYPQCFFRGFFSAPFSATVPALR